MLRSKTEILQCFLSRPAQEAHTFYESTVCCIGSELYAACSSLLPRPSHASNVLLHVLPHHRSTVETSPPVWWYGWVGIRDWRSWSTASERTRTQGVYFFLLETRPVYVLNYDSTWYHLSQASAMSLLPSLFSPCFGY